MERKKKKPIPKVHDKQERLYQERLTKYKNKKAVLKRVLKIKNLPKEEKTSAKEHLKELKKEKDIINRIKPRNGFQRTVARIRKITLCGLGCCIAVFSICAVGGYFYTKPYIIEAQNIAYEKLSAVDENTFSFLTNTTIYDTSGNLMSTLVKSNYEYLNINDVPENIQDGYIAVEDKRFLQHNGIDYKALARAGIELIKNKGHITQGGSTITQQVIKNMLLTDQAQERSYKRKLIEFFLAPELEKRYNKSDIMEFYTNSCYYGNGCYGIASAADYFFNKKPSQLTLAECALIVGMSNSPSRYNPINNPDEALARRNLVLSKMLEQGYISQSDFDVADNEELNLNIHEIVTENENYQVSYAIHCATLKMMELNDFEFKYDFENQEEYQIYKESYKNTYTQYAQEIRAGGYKITTSFNQELQDKLQYYIDEGLSGFYNKDDITGKYLMQGAAVVVDNNTGFVRAIVGGRGANDEFNRGFLAKRQPGSAMKPIGVYGPAMDTGKYYPSLIMEDKYIDGGPKNYTAGSYSGRVTLRYALAKSINTIPFQIMMDIKPKTALEYLGKMHFTSLCPSDNVGVLSLGGMTYGTTVCDMAKAFYTVQNNGIYTDNNCIEKLEFQSKGVLYDGTPNKTQVYNKDVAYILTDMLKTAASEGTGAEVSGHPSAGKTGTTSDNKDGWYVGFTKQYTTAVWVGYDTPRKIEGLAKKRYAVNIWKNFMDDIHKNLDVLDWDRPESVINMFVDVNGNYTSKNTGKSEMFSKELIERLEEEKKVSEAEYLQAYENEWKKKDKDRQQLANDLLYEYLSMSCTSIEDLNKIDKKYKEVQTAINLVSDTTVKAKLTKDLDMKHSQLDAERKPWEELQKTQLEETARQKEEAKEAKKEAERKAAAETEERRKEKERTTTPRPYATAKPTDKLMAVPTTSPAMDSTPSPEPTEVPEATPETIQPAEVSQN